MLGTPLGMVKDAQPCMACDTWYHEVLVREEAPITNKEQTRCGKSAVLSHRSRILDLNVSFKCNHKLSQVGA